jgi:acyl dehydratase
MLTMALTARALTDRVGHESLRTFGGRFRAQVWPGDTLNAVVEEATAAEGRAFTVVTRNQNGGLVFEATATTR